MSTRREFLPEGGRPQGFTSPQIVQAAGTTSAANYQTLTGRPSAYQDLVAAMQGVAVTSDNPFGT